MSKPPFFKIREALQILAQIGLLNLLVIDIGNSSVDSVRASEVNIFNLSEFIAESLETSSRMEQIKLDLMIAHQSYERALSGRWPSISFNVTVPSYRSSIDRIQRFTGEGYQEWDRTSESYQSNFLITQALPTGGTFGVSSDINKIHMEETQPGGFSSITNNFSSGVVVNYDQPLFSLNTYSDNLFQAGIQVEKAELSYRFEKENLIFELATEYLNHIKNLRRLEYLERSLERTEVLLVSAETKLQDGVIPDIDYLQAKLDLSNSRIALIETREDVQKSGRVLARRIKRSSGNAENIKFYDSLQRETIDIDFDNVRGMALNGIDIEQIRLDDDLSQYNVKATRKKQGFSTNLNCSAGWKGDGEFISDGLERLGFNLWSVSLAVSIPLWDGGLKKAELRETEYMARSASLKLKEKIEEKEEELIVKHLSMSNSLE